MFISLFCHDKSSIDVKTREDVIGLVKCSVMDWGRTSIWAFLGN